MRVSEARWIARQLAARRDADISPLLNIGSSTAEFREQRQPHIDREIFAPLRSRGIAVIHTDLKSAPGVDIAGDLMDSHVRTQLRACNARALLTSNLLEHVVDRAAFAAAMRELLPAGGYVVATVPRSYPYHADPIDTGYRPAPEELAALFPRCEIVTAETVVDTTYAQELRTRGPVRAARALLGALRPWGEVARSRRDNLRWLLRPFSTSCVVLRAV
jgi:hypothetical protein